MSAAACQSQQQAQAEANAQAQAQAQVHCMQSAAQMAAWDSMGVGGLDLSAAYRTYNVLDYYNCQFCPPVSVSLFPSRPLHNTSALPN